MGLYDFMYLVPRDQYRPGGGLGHGGGGGGGGSNDGVAAGDVRESQINNIEVTNGGTVVLAAGEDAAAGRARSPTPTPAVRVGGGRALEMPPSAAKKRSRAGGRRDEAEGDADPTSRPEDWVMRERHKEFALADTEGGDGGGERRQQQQQGQQQQQQPQQAPARAVAASSAKLRAAGKVGNAVAAGTVAGAHLDDAEVSRYLTRQRPRTDQSAATTATRRRAPPKAPKASAPPRSVMDKLVRDRVLDLQLRMHPPRKRSRTVTQEAVERQQAQAVLHELRDQHRQTMRESAGRMYAGRRPVPAKRGRFAIDEEAALVPGPTTGKRQRTSAPSPTKAVASRPLLPPSTTHKRRRFAEEDDDDLVFGGPSPPKRLARSGVNAVRIPLSATTAAKRGRVGEEGLVFGPSAKRRARPGLNAVRIPLPPSVTVKRGRAGEEGLVFGPSAKRRARPGVNAVRLPRARSSGVKRGWEVAGGEDFTDLAGPPPPKRRPRAGVDAVRMRLPPSVPTKRGRAGEEGLVFGPRAVKKRKLGPGPPQPRKALKRKREGGDSGPDSEDEEEAAVEDALLNLLQHVASAQEE